MTMVRGPRGLNVGENQDYNLRRLSNALSALYPRGTEEKRLVDAMLLAASSR